MITALIDGDFLMYICSYQKANTPQNTLESVINSTDTFLQEIFKVTEATHYLGFLTGSPNFRKEISPDYKANRVKKELPEFFRDVRNHLVDNWNFIYKAPYEADDLLNMHKNDNTIIVSTDKDLLLLPGLHYNPVKKTFISTTPEDAEKAFWSSMITGDRSDNIKGLPGKGIRYVEALLVNNVRLELSLPALILGEYIKHYGEYSGINKFNTNYNLLKILEKPLETDSNFQYLEPIQL